MSSSDKIIAACRTHPRDAADNTKDAFSPENIGRRRKELVEFILKVY